MGSKAQTSFARIGAKLSGYTPSYAAKLLRAGGLHLGSSREEMEAFFKSYLDKRDRSHANAKELFEIDGDCRSFASWCRKIGLRHETVRHRVRSLMQRDPSLTTGSARLSVLTGIVRGDMDFPTRGGGDGRRITRRETYEINGEHRTLHDWASIARVPHADIRNAIRRIKLRGGDPTEAIRRRLRRAGIAA